MQSNCIFPGRYAPLTRISRNTLMAGVTPGKYAKKIRIIIIII